MRSLLPATLPEPADPPWCKLLIWNAQGQCLLVRSRGQWEVPGGELPAEALLGEAACRTFLTQFARELGMECPSFRRAATVVQHFAQGSAPTPFLWYEAQATDRQSAPTEPQELRWQTPTEAFAAIPYPSGRRILEQIVRWPGRLIVGEYEVDYTIDPPGGRLRVFRELAPESEKLSISPEPPDTSDAQAPIH